MGELIGWMIVVGLAVVIAGIFMLSSQLEKHMRNTIGIMVHSHEMILARLERLANPSARASEPAVGDVLDRRRAQRRDLFTRMSSTPGEVEQGASPRRRLDDLLSS